MQSIPNLNEASLKIVYPQIIDLPYAAQEAINILRGNIQLSGNGIKVIAVTSSHKEEGKSSIAIQLTKSFAALNKTAVYVDCDIQLPLTGYCIPYGQSESGYDFYWCGCTESE